MGPRKLIFFGSRGSLDEPESGSIQPDFMLKARDIVELVKPSPPRHPQQVLMSKMLYFWLAFTGLTTIPTFFEQSEFSVAHLDHPAKLFLI